MISKSHPAEASGDGFTVSAAARTMVARYFQGRTAIPIRIFHNVGG